MCSEGRGPEGPFTCGPSVLKKTSGSMPCNNKTRYPVPHLGSHSFHIVGAIIALRQRVPAPDGVGSASDELSELQLHWCCGGRFVSAICYLLSKVLVMHLRRQSAEDAAACWEWSRPNAPDGLQAIGPKSTLVDIAFVLGRVSSILFLFLTTVSRNSK